MAPTSNVGSPDWWPTPLVHVRDHNFFLDDMVTVAEYSESADRANTRELHFVFAPSRTARRMLNDPQLLSSYMPGLGLSIDKPQYKLEPLIAKWEGGSNTFVQMPTLPFLAYFGLTPRIVEDIVACPIVYWDDLSIPVHGVIESQMVNTPSHGVAFRGLIRIRQDYLVRFATENKRSIVALWYEWNESVNRDESGTLYSEDDFADYHLPGRMIGLRQHPDKDNAVTGEFWGVRPVFDPSGRIAKAYVQAKPQGLI